MLWLLTGLRDGVLRLVLRRLGVGAAQLDLSLRQRTLELKNLDLGSNCSVRSLKYANGRLDLEGVVLELKPQAEQRSGSDRMPAWLVAKLRKTQLAATDVTLFVGDGVAMRCESAKIFDKEPESRRVKLALSWSGFALVLDQDLLVDAPKEGYAVLAEGGVDVHLQTAAVNLEVRHVRALRHLAQSYAAAAAETQRLRKLEAPDDDEFFECNPTPFVARLHVLESAECSFAHRGSVVSLRADDVSLGPQHLAVSRLKLTDGHNTVSLLADGGKGLLHRAISFDDGLLEFEAVDVDVRSAASLKFWADTFAQEKKNGLFGRTENATAAGSDPAVTAVRLPRLCLKWCDAENSSRAAVEVRLTAASVHAAADSLYASAEVEVMVGGDAVLPTTAFTLATERGGRPAPERCKAVYEGDRSPERDDAPDLDAQLDGAALPQAREEAGDVTVVRSAKVRLVASPAQVRSLELVAAQLADSFAALFSDDDEARSLVRVDLESLQVSLQGDEESLQVDDSSDATSPPLRFEARGVVAATQRGGARLDLADVGITWRGEKIVVGKGGGAVDVAVTSDSLRCTFYRLEVQAPTADRIEDMQKFLQGFRPTNASGDGGESRKLYVACYNCAVCKPFGAGMVATLSFGLFRCANHSNCWSFGVRDAQLAVSKSGHEAVHLATLDHADATLGAGDADVVCGTLRLYTCSDSLSTLNDLAKRLQADHATQDDDAPELQTKRYGAYAGETKRPDVVALPEAAPRASPRAATRPEREPRQQLFLPEEVELEAWAPGKRGARATQPSQGAMLSVQEPDESDDGRGSRDALDDDDASSATEDDFLCDDYYPVPERDDVDSAAPTSKVSRSCGRGVWTGGRAAKRDEARDEPRFGAAAQEPTAAWFDSEAPRLQEEHMAPKAKEALTGMHIRGKVSWRLFGGADFAEVRGGARGRGVERRLVERLLDGGGALLAPAKEDIKSQRRAVLVEVDVSAVASLLPGDKLEVCADFGARGSDALSSSGYGAQSPRPVLEQWKSSRGCDGGPMLRLRAHEDRVKLKIAPLRCRLDAELLRFLDAFFGVLAVSDCEDFEDGRGDDAVWVGDKAPTHRDGRKRHAQQTPATAKRRQGDAKYVLHVAPIEIKLDYIPRGADLSALRRGSLGEMLHVFALHNVQLRIERHQLAAAAPGALLEALQRHCVAALQAQSIRFAAGATPLRPLAHVGAGLLAGDARAAGRAAAFEAARASRLAAAGLADALEAAADGCGAAKAAPGAYDPDRGDAREGVERARRALSRGFDGVGAAARSVAVRRDARTLAKAVPTVVLRPAVGASRALACLLKSLEQAIDRDED
ncbi:hypothetical protein M885DRAFT_617330 [Pelagophyceae sp. CCMP2097]|nr:hypothetical protein M885DRAFT_617330 [Pelagophyceae sp. CCMP2097]